MATRTDIPVPGVYFLPPPRPAPAGLPPLDVAAFIGFAEQGPLDEPVPIEDMHVFRAVFGGDLALARDRMNPAMESPPASIVGAELSAVARRANDTVYANLPSAVGAFFANGGRRCYVVRVAGAQASATRFRLPGLVAIDEDNADALGEAVLSASSAGRWSARLRLATRLDSVPLPAHAFHVVDDTLEWQTGSAPQAIQPAELLRLTFTDGIGVVARVGDISYPPPGDPARLPAPISSAHTIAHVRLSSIWRTDPAAGGAQSRVKLPATDLHRVERLRFDLQVWDGTLRQPRIVDLGFNAGHPRFWGNVVAAESSTLRPHVVSTSSALGESIARAALFALLDPELAAHTTYLPHGMPDILEEAERRGPDAVDIGNDDLGRFDASMFLDDHLVPEPSIQPSTGTTLVTQGFDLHYVQGLPIRGLHSVLFVDEVALLAVPDAIHRGWEPANAFAEPTQPPQPAPPAESADWSAFNDCDQPIVTVPPPSPERPPATPLASLPELVSIERYDNQPLLAIQHAMLNVCQGRSDMLALFAMPSHFGKRQCIEWEETFRERVHLPRDWSTFNKPTGVADLSYAAAYHPWLLVRDETAADQLRAVPPDGAVCGMIAARERTRQVWIAAANVPLQGVLGLHQGFSRDDWADLFDARFNLIRPEPRDFRAMSAHTLSDERIFIQVSVRRLMILLRKLAIQRGMDYVFENNDQELRQRVRNVLEDALRFMYRRGAFSGATAAESYRVRTDTTLNPPQSIDLGRLIVEIEVAPAQVSEFITVLLLRVHEGSFQALEV